MSPSPTYSIIIHNVMISFIVSSHPPDGTFSADKRMRDGTYRTRAKNASLKLDFSKDLRKFLTKSSFLLVEVCLALSLRSALSPRCQCGCDSPLWEAVSALLIFSVSDRRFTDNTNRVVNAPTVRIQEPPTSNGVNPSQLSEALSSGKSKKKAYRR